MKNKNAIFITSLLAMLFSSCQVQGVSSNNISSESNSDTISTSENASNENDSSISEEPIEPDKKSVLVDDKATYRVEYGDGYVLIHVTSDMNDGTHNVFFTFNKDYGLNENNSQFFQLKAESRICNLMVWNGSAFEARDYTNKVKISYGDNGSFDLKINNSAFTSLSTKPVDRFAIFPEYYDSSNKLYNLTSMNPYILYNYPQTWIMIKEDGELYRDLSFENSGVSNWKRPKFTDIDGSHVTFHCSETTVEACIVSAMCSERMGATAFDVRLEELNKRNLFSEENIERITHSVQIPTMGILYDGSLTQQERLNKLKIAVQAGCSVIDLQGFMFYEGDNRANQTIENINYWESRGFDMSFVSSSPTETIIDPIAISKQKDYIEQIHSLGGEVLLSSHNQAIFTKEQAISYAKFIADRGVDVIKLVAYGETKDDILACIEANKVMENYIDCKFSMHLNSDGNMRITRLVCPLFYGAFLSFCYEYQTHVSMMHELMSKNDKPGKTIDLESAFAYIKENTSDSEIYLAESLYNNAPTAQSGYVAKAYGVGVINDRWTMTNEQSDFVIRKADDAADNFNVRAYSYDRSHLAETFSYSCSIYGDFIPYCSGTKTPTRVPKVGIMFGDERHLVAYVADVEHKTIGLYYNKLAFNRDSIKGDRLVNTALFSSTFTGDVDQGDVLNMGVYYDGTVIKFYFSEYNEPLIEVATISANLLDEYLDEAAYVGSILEIYMSTASKLKGENTLSFRNISFTAESNVFNNTIV